MTGPKEAAAGLRESEARFGRLVELVADFYWETDAEHRFTVIEANGVSQPDFSPASRLGRTRWEVSSLAPDAEGWRAHRKLLDARQPFRHFETAHLMPDGEIRYYMVAGEPFHDAQGAFRGYWGIGREITERKRAEVALRDSERVIREQNALLEQRVRERTAQLSESEARYRSYFESSMDAQFLTAPDGSIVDVNAAACAMLGRSAADIKRLGRNALVDPTDPRLHAALETRTRTGTVRAEISMVRADGTKFPVELASSVFTDAAGQPRTTMSVRDISGRKAAEAMRAHLAAVVESADHAIISKKLDGTIESWNEGATHLFGYRAAEAIGQHIGILIPPEHAHEEAAIVSRIERGERISHFETQRLRKDATLVDVSLTVSPIKDDQGQIVGASKIALDITARKQAEHRIRTQLEHLRLLDQITHSIGERLDLQSIFQIVLARLEDSLPVDFGCVCLYDAVANMLQVASVGVKSGALAHGLALEQGETIGIDRNGLSRCVQGQLVYEPDLGQVPFAFPERLARGGLGSVVLAPLRSESRVFGVLVVARREAQAFSSVECEFLRQLSEHVALAAHQAQLYGSLQQAYDDLRQTQQAAMQEERLRALGQMASGIAHDINNALSPVSLYVESLLESEHNLSERARGYLETIQRAVDDVAQTVARMREFYRQREQQLVLAPVQMNSMVQQVVDLTRARWHDMPQQRGIVIRVLAELAPDLPQVMGVESEIREALTNLVLNAVDAMPEGGTLTLRTRLVQGDAQHPTVTIEVADNGAGMDADTRQRCLEPFFTTKGERGTGLGLAMVFGMVQRHSAELAIDSAPGAGTTARLVFTVPAAVQAEPGQPTATEVPTRLRLLLIDDDPVLLKSLRDTLESDGHVIVTTSGGEAGIAAFRAALGTGESFATVITDLGMPYVDGRRVATAVKQASPATPVILLTGWGQRLVADGDIPAHVDRVLAKPPRLRELRAALALLCRQPRPPEAVA